MIKARIGVMQMQEGEQVIRNLVGEYDAVLGMFIEKDESSPHGRWKTTSVKAVEGMGSRELADILARTFADQIMEIFEDEPARVRQAGQTVWDELRKASRHMIIRKEMEKRYTEQEED